MYIIDDIYIHSCSFLENKVYFSNTSSVGDDCASSGYRSYSIHVQWVSKGCTKNHKAMKKINYSISYFMNSWETSYEWNKNALRISVIRKTIYCKPANNIF